MMIRIELQGQQAFSIAYNLIQMFNTNPDQVSRNKDIRCLRA